MKKSLIAILAAIMAAASTVTAYAASAGMEGLPVDIRDWDTPAVFAVGKDWPITVWYFYGENGEVLGSIPADAVKDLSQGEPADGIQWEFWLAEAFNDYRKLYSAGEDKTQPQPNPEQINEEKLIPQEVPPAAEPEQADADALALEAFDLINEARAENGLHEVTVNEEAMELAKIRVPELEELYSHTRPDGSRISRTYCYGEIINRRASTPEIAVSSWLDSPGHRDMILAERYHSAGIACWQGSDGITYWCMLFCR